MVHVFPGTTQFPVTTITCCVTSSCEPEDSEGVDVLLPFMVLVCFIPQILWKIVSVTLGQFFGIALALNCRNKWNF